jgi:hypothetical protein
MGILESDDSRMADIGLMMAGTKQLDAEGAADAAR